MFVNFNILNQLGSPAINSNTFANRPAAGQTGRLFVSTDTYEIYRDNGTTWDLIGGPGSSTITGSGTATQVAYFTSSQAIGSSANLFWDNTSGFLGVGTAAPTTRIEAVKTDGIGIYANYTTNAGSGSSATAIWAKNVTNSSGFAAVIEETTPNATAGQYPLLIKHSLSSGTAGVGMGTGVHWQLPDDAGTFKTTQLTIETINAAAATYATRYRFNVQSNGSSTPVAYINATGVGIFTATPGAALDVHSTGTIAQFNTTSATGNTYIAFQRTGSGLWRIGDTYNGGNNFFELHNTVLAVDALEFEAATNKSFFVAQQIYTTGLARGNYFDYNLSVAAGGSFSSPNAITALTATLDLTLAGNATIPSGARSGLDAYNSISFNGAGTLTLTQGTQIRAYSNLTTGWAFNGNTGIGTVTHLAGLRVLFPDNTGNPINVTNNYALLLNDQTANTGTVTYTNRWGVYQEGASDLNYLNANLLLGSTVNNGNKLQVTGNGNVTGTFTASTLTDGFITINAAQINRTTGNVELQFNAAAGVRIFGGTSYPSVFESGTGRLGVSTSSPIGKLHVQGVGSGQSIRTDHTSNYSFLFTTISNASPIAFDNLGGALAIYTASTERIRVTTSGEVGIGTNNPQYTFHTVSANTTIGAFRISSAAAGQLLVGNSLSDTAIRTLATGDSIVFSDTSRYLAFGTGGATERARITSGGNFLIGTTTDSGEKLVVNGNIKSNSSIYTESGTITINSGVTSTIFTFGNAFGNTQVYMLTAMQSSGNTSWRLSAIVIGGDLAASGAYNVLTIGNNNISASFSGADLQITNSGGNATIIWRLLRLI
jgi:hypothetical protein